MEQPEQNDSTDEEELDIRSEKFNPMKALYSKKFKIQNVKKLDNVAVTVKKFCSSNNM